MNIILINSGGFAILFTYIILMFTYIRYRRKNGKPKGKCFSCPAAHTINEELVATEVMQSIPKVRDVILIKDVSDDLLNITYKIINHEVHA